MNHDTDGTRFYSGNGIGNNDVLSTYLSEEAEEQT